MQPSVTRSPAVMLVAAVALVLGACGSDKKVATAAKAPATTAPTTSTTSTTAAPKKAADPCALVTKEQAQQIVGGVTLGDAVPAGHGDDLLCQYTSDPNGPTAQVQVFVGAGAKKSLDIDKDTLGHPFDTVPDVGDEAYLEDDNVWVRKGETWVQINVVDLDAQESDIRAGLTTAAKAIADQL